MVFASFAGKMKVFFRVIQCAGWILCASVGAAMHDGVSLGYRFERQAPGVARVIFQVEAPRAGMWLGVSCYSPLKTQDPVHQVLPLKLGYSLKSIDLDDTCRGGTFEAAVWEKREFGVLSGMRAYVTSAAAAQAGASAQ